MFKGHLHQNTATKSFSFRTRSSCLAVTSSMTDSASFGACLAWPATAAHARNTTTICHQPFPLGASMLCRSWPRTHSAPATPANPQQRHPSTTTNETTPVSRTLHTPPKDDDGPPQGQSWLARKEASNFTLCQFIHRIAVRNLSGDLLARSRATSKLFPIKKHACKISHWQ